MAHHEIGIPAWAEAFWIGEMQLVEVIVESGDGFEGVYDVYVCEVEHVV